MKKPNIRFAFTIPNGMDFYKTPAGRCYMRMMDDRKHTKKFDAHSKVIQGSRIGPNRNRSVSDKQLTQQKEFNFDYLLFIDFDSVWTEEDVIYLLDMDVAVVAGAVQMRGERDVIAAGMFKDIHSGIPQLGQHCDVRSGGPCQVDWVGMGFTMIKADVFANNDAPWFYDEKTFPTPETFAIVGEDIMFCWDTGFESDIYVNFNARIGHVLKGDFSG